MIRLMANDSTVLTVGGVSFKVNSEGTQGFMLQWVVPLQLYSHSVMDLLQAGLAPEAASCPEMHSSTTGALQSH